MSTWNTPDYQANLAALLKRAKAGEDVVITEGVEAVAGLVPLQLRVPGSMRGDITVIDENWWSADPELADQFGTA